MLDELEYNQIREVLSDKPAKLVLSNCREKTYLYRKTILQKMIIKESTGYQKERFTDKQVFHENLSLDELEKVVFSLFPNDYTQLSIFSETTEWNFKVTKKGKLLSNKKKLTENPRKNSTQEQQKSKRIVLDAMPLPSHNRKKNYLLQEGTIIPPLVDLGIFTKDGKIVNAMYDKYKQINRFLEMVEDVIKQYEKSCWHIIDFGCGKSYLTFILYYYLTEVKGISVEMTGLDLKEAVIVKCNQTAEKYGYDHLHFELGDINGYQSDNPVDMVVTLHACDTATDFALFNAVKWKADVILSVPCCQHEINKQIKSEEFSLLTKYGIIKERVSALMTDAIRANVLEYMGYRTQLLEFVDLAHSPKNILIRAVKGQVSEKKKKQAKEEILRLCKEFSLEPTLVQLLMKEE